MDDGGRISRRALIAAGAGAAAGVVGFGIDRSIGRRSALHRLGLLSSPDHKPTKAGPDPTAYVMVSKEMRGKVRYAISMPEDPTGVIICLHGRGNNERAAFDAVRLHDMVAEAGERFVVVGVDGGPDSYWHKRASGIDPLAMVQTELLRRVDTHIGALLPRAIIGWSMGGYGALLAAQRAPRSYRAVVASSPALFRSYGEATKGAFYNADDFKTNNVFPHAKDMTDLVVRVDCGTDDPFLDAARAFAARLPKKNPGEFSAGFHDAAYWRSVAPAQIRTIAAALHG